MSERYPSSHPLRTLFIRVVDRAFHAYRDLYSPGVASHIGDNILGGFMHVDHLYRLRDAGGARLRDLPEMIEVAHEKEGPERRLEVDGYIGDFVLFMGGFFPSALRRGRWLTPGPMISKVGKLLVKFSKPIDYYVAEGRNAYSRAAATALRKCASACSRSGIFMQTLPSW